MENFEPKTVLIVVTLMVCLAIVLDFLRRRKRNRYDNIQMSSRDLERNARGKLRMIPLLRASFRQVLRGLKFVITQNSILIGQSNHSRVHCH